MPGLVQGKPTARSRTVPGLVQDQQCAWTSPGKPMPRSRTVPGLVQDQQCAWTSTGEANC